MVLKDTSYPVGDACEAKLPSTSSLLNETVLRLIGKMGPDAWPAGAVTAVLLDAIAETSVGVADVDEVTELVEVAMELDILEVLIIDDEAVEVEELVDAEVIMLVVVLDSEDEIAEATAILVIRVALLYNESMELAPMLDMLDDI